MNKKNFALLAVLYDTEGADLYHDIYFPIIKYVLATKCTQQIDTAKFYDITELQENIMAIFGIKMPLIVLKQCILAISKANSDFNITTYENGQQFQIKRIWNISINENIDTKMDQVIKYFDQLESEFKIYLQDKLVESDKTFLDFFIDNTEDLFKYLNDLDSATLVNENYLHIVRFLLELKENKIELFNIANDIFWGSCVAAFLKREVDLNIRPTNSIDYYLDSSLVMAILDFDSEANVIYAKELLEIILNSGNRAIVNTMTVKEIDSILYAVEKAQVPNPNTAIAEAYYRRNLSSSKILSLRNKLRTLIENTGIIIQGESDIELNNIITKYRNKPSVKELGIQRNQTNSENNFREIHDIYINDYIIKKRGHVQSREKINCIFVSLNSDLIQFIKHNYTGIKISPIIHPAKVVTELWIHSSKSTIVRKNGLIEVISRCIALNNTDVRHKLRLVSKYINEDELSKDDYSALYCALVNRSQKVLNEVVKISDIGEISDEEKQENIKIASTTIHLAIEEHSERIKRMEKMGEKLEEVSSTLQKTTQELDSIKGMLDKQVSINSSKQDEIEKLKLQINNKEKENQNSCNEIIKLKQKLKTKDRISEIEKLIESLDSKIKDLNEDREKSISLVKFYIPFFSEILAIVALIIIAPFSICNFVSDMSNMDITYKNLWGYITGNKLLTFGLVFSIVTFILGLTRIQNLFILSPKINKSRIINEQNAFWNNSHPEFHELNNQRKTLEEEMEHLKTLI